MDEDATSRSPVAPSDVGRPGDLRAGPGEAVVFELDVPDFFPESFRVPPWTRVVRATPTEGPSRVEVEAIVGAYSTWTPVFFASTEILGPRIVRHEPAHRRVVTIHRQPPSGVRIADKRSAEELIISREAGRVFLTFIGTNESICAPHIVPDGDVIAADARDTVQVTAFFARVSSDHCRKSRAPVEDTSVLVVEFPAPIGRPIDARVFVRKECHGYCVPSPDRDGWLEMHEGLE